MFVKKEVIINRPLKEVYDYVLNFSNLFEWDDHVVEGHRVDLGPIKVGSKFDFVYSMLGNVQNIQYILESLESEKQLRFRCEASSFSAIDVISFSSQGTATSVVYQADIDVRSRVKDLIFTSIMERVGDRVVSRLKEVLEKPEAIFTKGKPLSLLNLPYRFITKGWNSRRKNFSATFAKKKCVLITGPTSGLGKSTTFSLAGMGCDLILVARNSDKLINLEKELKERGFDRGLHSYTCDMQAISEVKSLCRKIISDGHRVDVLINNAGALFSEKKAIDGVERTTIVDLVAPWVLSCELLSVIKPQGCIINVSSGGMYSASLSVDKLKKPSEPFSGSKAYAYAKRGMNVLSEGLNRELKSEGVRVHCMHPGWANTPGVLKSLPGFHKLTKRFLRTSFQGADTIVWLAMHNPQQGGKFWLDRQIQPSHIVASTKRKDNDYKELRFFLDSFARPKVNQESL